MNNNVVKFPNAKRPLPVDAESDDLTEDELNDGRAPLRRGVLGWAWFGIRYVLFIVMYWLRIPVVGICNMISFPLLLVFLFSLYAFPEQTQMVTLFGITSFLAFVVAWAYDFILMALSPQDMITSL